MKQLPNPTGRKNQPAIIKPKKKSEPAAAEAPATTNVPLNAGFPVVGIGASAGGLAAFEAFFAGMPADTDPGMAFVWCSTWPRTTRASSPT